MNVAVAGGFCVAALVLLSPDGDAGQTTLPFDLADNLVRIPVEVNGRQRSGVLDSGASAVLVDTGVAREIGLQTGDPAGEAAGAGSEARQVLPVTIASLKAGPLRFNDLAGYAVDLGNLSRSAGFPVEVLIGAPAFRQGIVSVDYARRRVTFGAAGSSAECAAPIPLDIVHDVPVIELQLRPDPEHAPVRVKVLVDLGTRHNALVLGGPFVRSDTGRRLLAHGVEKEIGVGVGGRVVGSSVRMAEVRSGRMALGPLEVSLTSEVPAFENGSIDGSIGVPLWQGGVITFDYPGRRLCITRPASAAPGGRRPSAMH